ncbi:glutathione synthase [Neoehrlichia mikurensis]|uniref:Glutathione synthetase n=2 Tax=Neoehrlichia mikurensis TaxID=89586 RepID=A0A9Q9BSN6_9RICK|nr:glutathione synthase [Neoehrlichia mikurensis]UTO55615.1 glutathione synthase [Neoehrlichia mikurensis]UTO56536.1 glutathione synthase [Neoehrlichia mikurensis]
MDRNIIVEKDLSVHFINEAQRRGYLIFFYEPYQLAFKCNEPVAQASIVSVKDNVLYFSKEEELDLKSLDILFIRQNPPFDMRYITTTYILEKLTNVVLINNPKSLRDCPEKLFPLSFPQFIPPTIITENIQLIKHFYQEYKDVILKPLYSYGGNDVIRICEVIDIEVVANLMISKYNCPIVIQKFLPNIHDDKRVVLLDGKPIGAIKRKVFSQDEIRTNLALGSVPEATTLSDRDYEICLSVGRELLSRGLVFAGIDILNGYLLEVNVTSPCGILQINQIYNVALEKECWDCFESKLC